MHMPIVICMPPADAGLISTGEATTKERAKGTWKSSQGCIPQLDLYGEIGLMKPVLVQLEPVIVLCGLLPHCIIFVT